MKDSVEENPHYDVSESVRTAPVTTKGQRCGFLSSLVFGIVKRTAGSVVNMPVLEEPRFDANVLSDENIVSKVVYTWAYVFRKFEYAVEPTRRGFVAWFRIIFASLFYAGLPFLFLSALLSGCAYVVAQTLAITDLTVKIFWNVVIGMCLFLGAIFLGYIIYAVIAMLRRKPIKVPVPQFELVKPSK